MAEHNIPELEGANTLISKRELQKPTINGEQIAAKEEKSTASFAPPKPKTWKDKFRESFVGNDVQSIGDYIIFDILVPSFKSTILSVINNGASMFLNGGPMQQNYGGGYGYTNYSTRVIRNNNNQLGGVRITNNSPYGFVLKTISWGSEMEALSVLSDLRDYIYNANQVSVAKYYILARIPGFHPDVMDSSYGWYNLDHASVVPSPMEIGRWVIDLPKPLYLK